MSGASVRWSATLLKQLPTVRNKASALRCLRILARIGGSRSGPLILGAQGVFTGLYASRRLRKSPAQNDLVPKKIGAPVRCLQMVAKVYEKPWTDGRPAMPSGEIRELLGIFAFYDSA
jgi:hypothetical protein